jgi:hypothetical protein
MTIALGTQLGPYEILAPLGAAGPCTKSNSTSPHSGRLTIAQQFNDHPTRAARAGIPVAGMEAKEI